MKKIAACLVYLRI